MSDFLTRMVQRTLGLAPVVQPAIPSIFAPTAVGKDYSSRQLVLADEVAKGMVTGAGQREQTKSGDYSRTGSHKPSYHTRHTIEESPKPVRADKHSDRQSLLINHPENNTYTGQKENDRPTHHQREPGYALETLQTPPPQEIGPPNTDDSAYEQNGPPAPIPFLKKPNDIKSHERPDEERNDFQKEEKAASQETLPSGRDPDRVIHEQKITIKHVLSQKETDKHTREFIDGGDFSKRLTGSSSENKENQSAEKTTNPFVPATVKRVMSPAMPLSRPGIGMPIVNDPSEKKPAETVPSIKVTIGRIDVRAVMQQAAQPKRKSPAVSKLSLDEYLKKRCGKQG